MDQIKKIRTKLFKKSSASSKSRKDPKLRYSRSMPLRNSGNTEESYRRQRPVYRGDRPLRTIDIHGVFDISPEQAARYEDPHSGWPRSDDIYDDDSDVEGPYLRRFPLGDRDIVNQFPVPPSNRSKPLPKTPSLSTAPNRPCRPPTLDLSGLTEKDLLPEYDPVMKAKMDTLAAQSRAAHRHAPVTPDAPDAQSFQRSTSSSLGCTRPLNINRRHDAHTPDSNPTLQSCAGIYKNTAANNSTRSLDPHARYRTCLASSRKAAAARGTPSQSNHAIFNSTAHNKSTQSLHPNLNARYQAALTTPDEVHIDTSYPATEKPVSVRRRNASSTSSRSTRRHGMITPTPADPLIPYHPDLMRVIRGPHGSKLSRDARPPRDVPMDIGLEVNDTDGREWGTYTSRVAGGAATITGYGRGVLVSRR